MFIAAPGMNISDYTETHKKIQVVAPSTKEVQIEEMSKKKYQVCEKIG